MACVQQVPGVSSKRLTEEVATLEAHRVAGLVLHDQQLRQVFSCLFGMDCFGNVASLSARHICHIINMADE
jgi:hypothetical protein